MPANDYPPGDTPPPLLTKGPGYQRLNQIFGWLISMATLPADTSLVWVPGTPTSPGRLRATATGSGSAVVTPPLTVVDASAKDSAGTHPGRIRIHNGFLGNLLPAEMKIPDGVLPDKTDNRCYLTMQNGTNYVLGKVLVDKSSGQFTGANIYSAQSNPNLDGNNAYLLIAVVTFDGTKLGAPSQLAAGNQSLLTFSSVDGTILTPFWSSSFS